MFDESLERLNDKGIRSQNDTPPQNVLFKFYQGFLRNNSVGDRIQFD